ncbi:oligosaccharide repeat unit polymerase [Micromonospora sagamiensis]|uniref:Uncharacterized protein n=1 Tax=Micromonospora sagamiensis TaxID=47875 RepID=A0A562WJV3_9ACTN|nr:oligosaccharide repeat unit polymerase [Micromonospora sagamiensis]TWJ30321.1 hypothetical protein JD81_03859 [Micromonospora sagamiensis]BCL16649.1 hypothetical protein GCM10017556_43880 [Micromonospora sagamiensis]
MRTLDRPGAPSRLTHPWPGPQAGRVDEPSPDRPHPERRWLLLIPLAGYVTLLHHAYQHEIVPLFEYLNLVYRTPDTWNYALALGMVAVVAVLMPQRIRRPSDFVLWVLFVMAVVPSIVVPQYADILPASESLELAAVVAAVFLLVVGGARFGPSGTLRVRGIQFFDVWAIVVVLSLITYAYMTLTAGLSFRLVGLGDVWEIRSAYRDQVAASGPVLGYLVRLQGNVLNPLLIARGIYARRWTMALLGGVGQIPIFAATGFKLTLLSIPAIVALALLFRGRGSPRAWTIVAGVVGIIAAALVADALLGSFLYTQVFVNRLFIAPGVVTAAHVMVFADLPKARWGHSFLRPFVDYPYDQVPDHLVGAVMFEQPQTSANASLFGDGYSNLGYGGVLIEAAVLVLLLWAIDGAARHLPLKVSGAILLVPAVALANMSVFTSILSNGFAYAIVLMACLPAAGWDRAEHVRGTSGGPPGTSPGVPR